jgi:zinc finger BED domain-containing protein 1 (E3 SUMO-protein ligase ZBED1)
VEHFKKSCVATAALKQKQQQMSTAEHQLIQDVATRWNSSFLMIERLLEQRWPISAVLSDSAVTDVGKRYQDLKTEDWKLLEGLTAVLSPFKAATQFLSGDLYVSLSCLIPVITVLVETCCHTW